jgi:hypothetical protein
MRSLKTGTMSRARHLLHLVSRVSPLCLAVALTCCGSGVAQVNAPGTVGSTRLVLLNKARFPQARQELHRPQYLKGFPNLKENFEVLRPSSPIYNCISHTLRLYDRWIDPQIGPSENPLGPMDRLYATQGYSRLPRLDFSLESGKQKVALYAHTAGGKITKVTHAALQSSNGTWTSKLGKLALIRHLTLGQLSGPEYGVPIAVYIRNVPKGNGK